MEFSARQIAIFLGGEVIGDMDVKINNVSKIEEGKPGTLTFLANPKYNEYIYSTKASVVLVNRSFIPEREIDATLIKVQDAYAALATLMEMYVQAKPKKTGIEIPSYISANAVIGSETYVGAFSYIGENVKIGKNVQIHPQCWIGESTEIKDNTIIFAGVKIYPETKIGENCVIHAGAVIGSDGFGFAPQQDGTYKKIHQIGNVVIEDNVEIGANCTIDCATMGSTIIHKGVKLDNMVQVAHNVEIGQNTVVAALTAFAGSCSVGENCIFGGQAAVAGHIKVGNKVTVGGKTGVTNNTPDNSILLGEYGIDAAKYKRASIVFRKLPEIYRDINQIKKDLQKPASE